MKNKVFTTLIILIAAFALVSCASAGGAKKTESADGITLKGKDATIHSDLDLPSLCIEQPNGNLGYWHHVEEYVTWNVEIPAAGTYMVSMKYAAWGENAGSAFSIEIGGKTVEGVFKRTSMSDDGYFAFKTMDVGTVDIEAGAQVLTMKVTELTSIAAGNVLKVILTPQ